MIYRFGYYAGLGARQIADCDTNPAQPTKLPD